MRANGGVIQRVVLNVLFLNDTIDVDLQPRCLAASVVGHSNVDPLIGRNLIFADNLQGLRGPAVNNMHAHATLLHPEIPATMSGRGFHASPDGSTAVVGRNIDPCSIREWLITFEVADRSDIKRSSLDVQSFSIGTILPLRGVIERYVDGLTVKIQVHEFPVTFIQPGLQMQPFWRNGFSKDFRFGSRGPRIEFSASGCASFFDRSLRGNDQRR